MKKPVKRIAHEYSEAAWKDVQKHDTAANGVPCRFVCTPHVVVLAIRKAFRAGYKHAVSERERTAPRAEDHS